MAISIYYNSANDISNLIIDIGNSSFFGCGNHVSSSNENGLESYAIDLSNAKNDFRLDFTFSVPLNTFSGKF